MTENYICTGFEPTFLTVIITIIGASIVLVLLFALFSISLKKLWKKIKMKIKEELKSYKFYNEIFKEKKEGWL